MKVMSKHCVIEKTENFLILKNRKDWNQNKISLYLLTKFR